MKVIVFGDNIPAEIISITTELKLEPYPDRKRHYKYVGDFIYDYFYSFVAGQSLFKQARVLTDEKAAEVFIREHKSRADCVVQWTNENITSTLFMQIISSQAEHDSKIQQFTMITASELRRLMITPDGRRAQSRINPNCTKLVRVEIPYETKHGYVTHTYDSDTKWDDHFFEVSDTYGTYRIAADTYYDSGSTELVSFVRMDGADSTVHELPKPLETKKKGTVKNPPEYTGPAQRPMPYASVGERMACLFQHVPTVPTRVHISQVAQEFSKSSIAAIKAADLVPISYKCICELLGHVPHN